LLIEEVDRFIDFELAFNDAGYMGLFCKKAWKKIKDGSAVFWRSGKLSLKHSEHVLLTRDDPMKALLVGLSTASGVGVTVCSTHLKCGMDKEHVRVEQIMRLDRALEAFAHGSATILCGDLNAHFAPLRLCTSDCCCDPTCIFEPKVLPALEEAGFRSSYSRYPSFTTWCGFADRDIKATFDYILTRGAVETRSILEVPSENYVIKFPERLPNESCPSDHFCLAADLELCIAGHCHAAALERLGIWKAQKPNSTTKDQRNDTANPKMDKDTQPLASSGCELEPLALQLSDAAQQEKKVE
jgi:endonuclease/exonuclease/phosphatase family metal-dependent hydrolase